MGQLCLGVIAKSTDGSVRSSGYQGLFVPGDRQFHMLSRVVRPSGSARQETDVLTVIVYSCGQSLVLKRKFNWRYVWPEGTGSASDNEAGNVELGTAHPWQAFSQNLEEEDFAALDALIKKWNNPKERDRNGEWKLDGFRSVFVNYSAEKRDWKGDLQRIQRWRAFNPRSAGAVIAEAKYWIAYAWHIRGGDNVAQTDPVALRVFGERMQHAEQLLKEGRDFSADNPLWYEAYLDVAAATRRDDKFTVGLFNEAINRHPYYQPLYLEMARHWASRLVERADWAKADEVIRQAAANTASLDGTGNYAALYIQLGDFQECGCNLFEESRLSWTRMRDSFENLVQRYPSTDNLNQYAAFACRAGDKSTYLKVRPRIVNRVVPDKWLDGYSPDLCDRRFVQNT